MSEEQRAKLNQEILAVVEKFDLDFNIGNVLFAVLGSHYSSKPVEELEKAKILIDRRIDLLKEQINNGKYKERICQ